MKKIIFPIIMLAAIAFGLYEQTKKEPNVFVLVICIAVFMFGMMRLSAKTPSKHKEDE